VLALLAEQPMHGYQIIQEIGQRSGGAWKPSPGSVYPTLQQLEDEGLVRAQELDGRRVYRLTEDGQRLAADRAEEFATLWETVAPSEDDTQIGDLIFQVGAAFVQVARTGTAEQMAEARKVLARTRADLYRILGDPADAAEGSKKS
jgi:DNA-binding PadR family transcriptional regulator